MSQHKFENMSVLKALVLLLHRLWEDWVCLYCSQTVHFTIWVHLTWAFPNIFFVVIILFTVYSTISNVMFSTPNQNITAGGLLFSALHSSSFSSPAVSSGTNSSTFSGGTKKIPKFCAVSSFLYSLYRDSRYQRFCPIWVKWKDCKNALRKINLTNIWKMIWST